MRAVLVPAILLSAAASPPDTFDRATGALNDGIVAESHADRSALRAAARLLADSGAEPVGGQDDVAVRWRRETRDRTVPVSRDRALGPGYRLLVLDAGAVAAFEQTFLAGQLARVAVVPAPASIVELSVTEDGSASPVCASRPARARCDWVPSYTQRFRIEVANR